MKKILLLLFLVMIFTGCCNSSSNINNIPDDSLVGVVFSNPISSANTEFKGYKVYLPNGVNLISSTSSNDILYSNKDKYYLYVDLISYYKNISNEYKVNDEHNSFFAKTFKYDKKNGYVLVTKLDDDFFVEVMYNYSKIEVITKNYKEAIVKSLIMLRSVTFNDKVIETLIGSNILQYDEEEFDLLGPSAETVDFLKIYDDADNEYKKKTEKEEQELQISDED